MKRTSDLRRRPVPAIDFNALEEVAIGFFIALQRGDDATDVHESLGNLLFVSGIPPQGKRPFVVTHPKLVVALGHRDNSPYALYPRLHGRVSQPMSDVIGDVGIAGRS